MDAHEKDKCMPEQNGPVQSMPEQEGLMHKPTGEKKDEESKSMNYHFNQKRSIKILKTAAMVIGCSAMVRDRITISR